MHYRLTTPEAHRQYINIDCHLRDLAPGTTQLELQLPAWRPGRYELQNFAKNIQRFAVYDQNDRPLPFRKLTKDRWQVDTQGATEVVVRYNYYAGVINAGSSYVDDKLLYVNFVNLCVYAEGRIDEPCTVALDVPPDWTIACGLTRPDEPGPADESDAARPRTLRAANFYELVDCPLIASPDLHEIRYAVGDVAFHVWLQGGRHAFDAERIRRDFSRFSEAQIRLFGAFPETDYHFLTIVLPTAYYHGVEHRNSTVLVLGPDDEGEGLYTDLLGVSSHELFHAWNIIRIRPDELLPYDFTRENYFTTCFVAEGVTTYYGDLMLRRAGVFDDAAYLKELQVLFKRHFEVSGRAVQSLVESSWDLWLDGYDRGVPDRKVSVYHKGATVALILDLHLRRKFGHERSLDDVMRLLWERFGEPFIGYTLDDYRGITEEIARESLAWYYDTCIFGNEPLEDLLNEYLAFVGLHLLTDESGGTLLLELDDEAGRAERARWLGE